MSGDQLELNKVAPLAPGEMVDHFKVLRQLGRGGMGEVYLARDTKLGRKVVLKLVLPEVLSESGDVERFLFEARATAKFAHPHIVTIYAVGEHSGAPYLALEYLEGQNLRERLSQHQFGVLEVVRVGLAIAEALSEAHAHDLIHRDLKPENVILPKDGRFRVLDFGLAKPLPKDDLAITKKATPSSELGQSTTIAREFETEAGLVGTPLYMAPEQWLQRPVTAKTDMWALGVMLYELLDGKRPFEAPTPGELRGLVCTEDAPLVEVDGVPRELRELVSECLNRDPGKRPSAVDVVSRLKALLRPGQARSEEDRPFRGLLPFTEDHAGFFFGRNAEVEAFVERLDETPALPVVGPSGAGKSSFVGAGVIPRLKERDRWIVIRARPGRSPFLTLSSALERGETTSAGKGARLSEKSIVLADMLEEHPGLLSMRLTELAETEDARVLLFVDQLEELYTQVDSQDARRGFMKAICTAADDVGGPVRVVFTLRDDFLGRVAETAAARTVLGQIKVLRSPDEDALRRTLTEPIERMGYSFDDPELPNRMLAAVAGEAASLPLLQFTCSRLWDQRDREKKVLTHAAYEAMGGVEGALAHHADDVFEGLTPEQEHVARQLLLCLITPEGTRKVASRKEILERRGDDGAMVLDRLAQGRMITARRGRGDDAELELAHESLITRWPRLRRWVDESREGLAFLSETGQAAELWDRRGRRDDELWGGEALQDAERRAAQLPEDVPKLVRTFLEAGSARERQRRRSRRGVITGAFVVLIALALVLLWLNHETDTARSEAERERDHAEHRRALALREGARANVANEAVYNARAKLRASWEVFDSLQTRALWRKLSRSPLFWKREFGDLLYATAFSPDGGSVATGGMVGVHVIDITTRRDRALRGYDEYIRDLDFSSDGRYLSACSWSGGNIAVWDLRDGSLQSLEGHQGTVEAAGFSPDGRWLATAGLDKTVRLWNVGSSAERWKVDILARALAFSPDGSRLATGGVDGVVRIVQTTTGREEIALPGHRGVVRGLVFSSDGELLISADRAGTTLIRDASTGRTKRKIGIPEDRLNSLCLSHDGQVIAAAVGSTVMLWDVSTGNPLGTLTGHDRMVMDVTFNPRKRLLATASLDSTMRLWDLSKSRRTSLSRGHAAGARSVAFSPDGTKLASTSVDRTIRLWDVHTGTTERVLTGHTDLVHGVAFSPDGSRLATASFDGTTRLWSLPSGTLQHAYAIGEPGFTTVFGPEGRLLATATSVVRLLDVESGSELPPLLECTNAYDVAFSPDGRLIACGSAGTVTILDAATGSRREVLRGHIGNGYGVAFSPDGARLASTGMDRTVHLWDLATGQSRIVATLTDTGYWLDFHPDGHRVGVPVDDGSAHIFDLRDGSSIDMRSGRSAVVTIRFSPDGALAAAAVHDGTVRLWDADTGRPVWRTTALLRQPRAVMTHLGMRRLDGSPDGIGGIDWDARSTHHGAVPDDVAWWQAFGDDVRTAAQADDGRSLCIATYGDELVMWDSGDDGRVFTHAVPNLDRLIAFGDRCLSLSSDGAVELHTRSGERDILHHEATAFSTDGDDILVATNDEIAIFDSDGHQTGAVSISTGVTAVGRIEPWLVLGHEDGTLGLVSGFGNDERADAVFEGVPASPVELILPGPEQTLVVGFASGQLAVWEQNGGPMLVEEKLHGPVIHAFLEDDELYVASELGDYTIVDLTFLTRERCAMLQEMWTEVPVVWREGHAVPEPPPMDHECAHH